MRTLMKNKHNAYRHSLRRIAMHSIRCDLMQPIAEKIRTARFPHRRTQQVTQLFTYLLTQRRTACHAHIGLFTFASWLSKTLTSAIAEICVFRGLIATKPYVDPVPHQNSLTKDTTLRCRLVPAMIPIARNCAVWAVPLSQTPIKSVHFQLFFGTCKTPCAEIRKFFNGLRMRTPIHVFYFQKCSKSVQDKWPKLRVVLVTKYPNTFWHP